MSLTDEPGGRKNERCTSFRLTRGQFVLLDQAVANAGAARGRPMTRSAFVASAIRDAVVAQAEAAEPGRGAVVADLWSKT